jgi:hypothetical protein
MAISGRTHAQKPIGNVQREPGLDSDERYLMLLFVSRRVAVKPDNGWRRTCAGSRYCACCAAMGNVKMQTQSKLTTYVT